MAWTVITSDSLKARMPIEWAAMQRIIAANGTTYASVTDGVIADVVSKVRGAIARGNRNGQQPALGAEGSVPPELVRATLILCRLDLAAVFPNAIALNDETRKSLTKSAEDDLKAVAKGELSVSPADDAAADPPPDAPGVYGGDDLLPWPGTDTTTTAS